jgi:phospholipid transport system substrate-binding protein
MSRAFEGARQFRARRLAPLLIAVLLATGATAARADPSPAATPQALYDALLKVMKGGAAYGFDGRLKILDPELRRDLNLPLMTRIVVGPPWKGLPPEERQRLVEAFSDYSIAVYASRFKDYSGEKFVVDPTPTEIANGDAVVHTKLLPAGDDPVQLDYLLRRGDGAWRIIDVFLSGSISELATRRSEYSTVLRTGGAEALVSLLRKKTAELRG